MSIRTLGCRVNQADSDQILRDFVDRGFEVKAYGEQVDVCIVDTCTVTSIADRKSRKAVRQAARIAPAACLVVTGCGAEAFTENFPSLPGVKRVFSNSQKGNLAELVAEQLWMDKGHRTGTVSPASKSNPARTRAFLKIQEGCDHYCTYCIVPHVRGVPRSLSLEAVGSELKRLARSGYREVVLTGIRLGRYGTDFNPSCDLPKLIEQVCATQELLRVRLSSLEPTDLTDALVHLFAEQPKLCQHLHLPVQSGDDSILAAMNRGYDSCRLQGWVAQLRDVVPDISLTADVMVGFPGETAEQFQHTLELAERLEFTRLHVFEYSPRPGTAAASFADQVPSPTKHERSRRLLELSNQLWNHYALRYVGKECNVLIESVNDTKQEIRGLTETFLKVRVRHTRSVPGELCKVKITAIGQEELVGTI